MAVQVATGKYVKFVGISIEIGKNSKNIIIFLFSTIFADFVGWFGRQ